MSEHHAAVVIGGGQAGLSTSYYLTQRGIDHVVLERERVGHAWRAQRWDSFCLVTPNWQCQLPDFPYAGAEPHGFMRNADIVRYVEAFAASFDPPVREGVSVLRVRPEGAGYRLCTTMGDLTADQVVVAVGGYHTPVVPAAAAGLPPDIVQLPSAHYRNPAALPPGEVLVVGTGQSGCQIAEDLHIAGRRVHLCTGSAPRTARRYRGRDVVEWLHDMGYYDMPVHEHPLGEGVRARANHYVTGRDGGRDIDLRARALEGMRLYGRLAGVDGTTLRFGGDLRANLDGADRVAEGIKTSIDAYITRAGVTAPHEARRGPVWEPAEETRALDLRAAGITAVVWCVGYRADYRWIDAPAFDERGHPQHERGVTRAAGFYFVGLPWLHSWGSGRFSGVARDAAHVVAHMAAHTTARAAPARNPGRSEAVAASA